MGNRPLVTLDGGLLARELGRHPLWGLLPAGYFGLVTTLARDLTEITALMCVSVLTIHPDAIPRGDQLLILPRWDRPEGATNDALALGSLIVPALPQCVPSPADSVMTRNGIEPR